MIINPHVETHPYISLKFSEKVTECSFDYVVIINGYDKKTKLLGTLSGNSQTSFDAYFNVRSSYLLIYFFRWVCVEKRDLFF